MYYKTSVYLITIIIVLNAHMQQKYFFHRLVFAFIYVGYMCTFYEGETRSVVLLYMFYGVYVFLASHNVYIQNTAQLTYNNLSTYLFISTRTQFVMRMYVQNNTRFVGAYCDCKENMISLLR